MQDCRKCKWYVLPCCCWRRPSLLPVALQGEEEDFKSVITSLRATYGVDYIYCWHGLPAYWSGISVEDPGDHQHVSSGPCG
jgi:Raffinose synthase or seed imbibition protein Sip1